MKEVPIIFSGPMVQAILGGRKTQTRRIIDIGSDWRFDGIFEDSEAVFSRPNRVVMGREVVTENCAVRLKYRPGDRLYVREAWRQAYQPTSYSDGVVYRADKPTSLGMDEYSDRHRWKPSIHMPKKYARLWLEVTGIRIERLQDIAHDDAKAEGITFIGIDDFNHIKAFRKLWDSINAKRAPWESNPWVWVVEFRPLPHTGKGS